MFIYHVVFHLLNLFGTFRAIHFSDNIFYSDHSVQSTILRLGPVCVITKFGYPKNIGLSILNDHFGVIWGRTIEQNTVDCTFKL